MNEVAVELVAEEVVVEEGDVFGRGNHAAKQ